MTAFEPAARVSEGRCPHPEHGSLQAVGRPGYCEACAGRWRIDNWSGSPALLFTVHNDLGRLTRVLTAFEVAHSRMGAGDALEAHVERTHRDALDPAERRPW